jgi:tRNA 2-thiouridine synthesizing protein A
MALKFEKKDDGGYLLDVCGFVCPHPQIYCKKSLEKIDSGEVLIKEQKQEGGKTIFVIEKA